MDGVVREMEREGKGIRLRNMEGEWDVNILLFADDAVLLAESEEKLRILVREFEGKCASMRLKVNPAKSKVMRIGGGDEEMWKEEWGGEWNVNILLFADDAVLLAESEEKLRILVREFEGKC